jgi:hypothetical protein
VHVGRIALLSLALLDDALLAFAIGLSHASANVPLEHAGRFTSKVIDHGVRIVASSAASQSAPDAYLSKNYLLAALPQGGALSDPLLTLGGGHRSDVRQQVSMLAAPGAGKKLGVASSVGKTVSGASSKHGLGHFATSTEQELDASGGTVPKDLFDAQFEATPLMTHGSLAGLSHAQLAQLEFPMTHKQLQQVQLLQVNTRKALTTSIYSRQAYTMLARAHKHTRTTTLQ